MRKVFNDSALQKQFDKDGYVRVPFMSPERVEKLKKAFFDTLPKSGGTIMPADVSTVDVPEITYDFTFIDKNPEYKQLVFDIITKEFAPEVEKYLAGFKPIIANFIRKKSEGGEVPLHQNWAFVEERKYTSVSIWCPLVDSTVANGTLQVVPGSHKRFGEFRGPMVPWELDEIKKDIIDKFLVPLETKAGDAIILDDSIVHYSAINKTTGLRLAIQLILMPKEIASVHYNLDPSDPREIKVWEVDKDFYMMFNPWMKVAEPKVIAKFPYKQKFLTVQEFEQGLKAPKIDEEQVGLLNRIKKLFLAEA
ncbi:MAG: hypothetical protein JWO06_1689 [Bacteroidota bacterium]|nr:hypothetical protein [Bacteroidota bacterium]